MDNPLFALWSGPPVPPFAPRDLGLPRGVADLSYPDRTVVCTTAGHPKEGRSRVLSKARLARRHPCACRGPAYNINK
jgi:hypothetical protein